MGFFQRPPPGHTCASYTQQYIASAGGYLQVGADGLCEFCQYATGDEFGHTFSVSYSHIWRDFGIFIAFIVFNYSMVYFASFLRFKAKNPFKALMIKRRNSGKA
jgi:ATP-binding cassette, subfamily G (WHITE), member 2, SNQ2